jgi:hypothetical protein
MLHLALHIGLSNPVLGVAVVVWWLAADAWPHALSLTDALSPLLLWRILCRYYRLGLLTWEEALVLSV